jgi:hypothetical protein
VEHFIIEQIVVEFVFNVDSSELLEVYESFIMGDVRRGSSSASSWPLIL